MITEIKKSFTQIFHKERLVASLQFMIILLALFSILSMFVVQLCVVCILFLTPLLIFKYGYKRSEYDVIVFAFIFFRMISVFLSEYPDNSYVWFTKELPILLLYYPLSQIILHSGNHYRRILIDSLLISGILASLYGIGAVVMGIVERAQSTTSGYYTLGTFLTTLLALCMVLLFNKAKTTEGLNRYYLIGALVLLVGIIATYNRIHWVIVVFLIIYFGITRYRVLLYGAVIVGAVIILTVPSIQERVLQLLHLKMSDRDILWKSGITKVIEHPFFGYGPYTFLNVFTDYDVLGDKKVGGWHNDYLRIIIESGFVGLVVLLSMIFTIIKRLYKKISAHVYDSYIKGIFFGFITILISSFTGSALFDILINVQWILLLSITEERPVTENVI